VLVGEAGSRRTLLNLIGQRVDLVTLHQAACGVWAVATVRCGGRWPWSPSGRAASRPSVGCWRARGSGAPSANSDRRPDSTVTRDYDYDPGPGAG
jgi:hypothetical protein